jgi:Tol biopolymer transport system component
MRTQWLHHARKVNLYIFCLGLLLPGIWSITFAASQRKQGPPKDTLYEIAFVRSDGIWTVNSDGSNLRKVYPLKNYLKRRKASKRISCAPAWSPTGDQLCFGDNEEEKLVVINRSGRVLRKIALLPYDPSQKSVYKLAHDAGYISFQKVVWTPRTNLIIAEYQESDFIYNILSWDGHRTRRIGSERDNPHFSDVSQDGQWIAYVDGETACEEVIRMRVFLENLKTHHRQQLYSTGRYHIDRLTLSPDGQRIAFARDPETVGKTKNLVGGLHVIDRREKLHQLMRSHPPYSPSRLYGDRKWSPDGHWIAFRDDERGGIYLYDLKRNKTRFLTQYGALVAWTSDSRYVITHRDEGLWRIAVPSGKAQKIVPIPADGNYASIRLKGKY